MTMKLHMFHGRHSPNEAMDDWGFDGPTIGGITSIYTTYNSHVRVEFLDQKTCEIVQLVTGWKEFDTGILEIPMHGDMMQANGKFYGDWVLSEEKRDGTRADESVQRP